VSSDFFRVLISAGVLGVPPLEGGHFGDSTPPLFIWGFLLFLKPEDFFPFFSPFTDFRTRGASRRFYARCPHPRFSSSFWFFRSPCGVTLSPHPFSFFLNAPRAPFCALPPALRSKAPFPMLFPSCSLVRIPDRVATPTVQWVHFPWHIPLWRVSVSFFHHNGVVTSHSFEVFSRTKSSLFPLRSTTPPSSPRSIKEYSRDGVPPPAGLLPSASSASGD